MAHINTFATVTNIIQLETKYKYYNSFHFETNSINEAVLNADNWPSGVRIKRFFIPKDNANTDSDSKQNENFNFNLHKTNKTNIEVNNHILLETNEETTNSLSNDNILEDSTVTNQNQMQL